MAKPTLIQTILNRPSKTYASPPDKRYHSHRQETPQIAAEARESTASLKVPPASSDNSYSPSRQRRHNAGVDVNQRSAAVEIQGSSSRAHDPSSSQASRSASTSILSTATSSTSTTYPPLSPSPPSPPKNQQFLDSKTKSSNSRNVVLNSALHDAQQPTATTSNHSGLLKPGSYLPDNEDWDEEDSTQDVFFTPNSSPRASIASEVSIVPMSHTAIAPTASRQLSRRSLSGKRSLQEHQPLNSHHKPNQNLENGNTIGDTSPKLASSSPSSNKKANSSDNPMVTTANKGPKVGITSMEPSSSRAPILTHRSPSSSSARIAVPSTRTPSRSNSLTKGRQADSRSGFSHSQGQGRAVATTSVVSTTSSMSSNTLEGHSIVFSDLTTDSTGVTAPSPGGSKSTGNSPKKDSGAPATNRRVDKGAGEFAKSTTTPTTPSSNPSISHPRARPTKSHTYNGLGLSSTSPNPSASQYQYQQQKQHRNRDKNQSVMLSMTAVLEAAEEDELYRYGKKKGGVGSPVWKARQLLRQHENVTAKPVVTAVLDVGAQTTSPTLSESKGKGKEKADVGGAVLGGSTNGRAPVRSASNGKGKGKERERDFSLYTKHQPITSSPLAVSSKPLPTLGSASSRNNGLLDVPGLSPTRLRHRRSRSMGAESGPLYNRSDSPKPFRPATPGTSASHAQQGPAPSPWRSGHSRSHSVSHSQAPSNVTSTNSGTVDLSVLPQSSGELPSKGTAGYTHLVLPRAPAPLNLNPDDSHHGLGGGLALLNRGDGKVDLTKDGLAQTTMASVEVVRGLGSMAGRKGWGKIQLLVRRKTSPAKVLFAEDNPTCSEEREQSGAGVQVGGGASVLGFTSYRKPPDYVPSGSVLVQVWAVGVDGVDGRLVGVRMGYSNAGRSVSPSPTNGEAGLDTSTNGVLATEAENQARVIGKDGETPKPGKTGLGRSLSLRERLSRSVSIGRSSGKGRSQQRQQQSPERDSESSSKTLAQSQSPEKEVKRSLSGNAGTPAMPGIGYIPGRSFVGRVVECGWDVRGEIVRKGDWVAGLLDVKKCGALTEFLVVDRHRIHRVPQPQISHPRTSGLSLTFLTSPKPASTQKQHSLTLEELALLPLCGVTAYRAVRTFMYAFSSMRDSPSLPSVGGQPDLSKHRPPALDPSAPLNFSAYGSMVSRLNFGDHENGRRRRALVLKGHDGVGAMAVQMFVLRGWRVCVHVPFIASPPNVPTTSAIADRFMEEVEDRIRSWGAEEVIFDDGEVVGEDEGRGAIVRVIDGLREDGDVFDAVLDTVGGKEVREAAERLLRSPGRRAGSDESASGKKATARGMGQFTTVVGDSPERPIPSAGDLFRAGLRSLKFGGGGGGGSSVGSMERGSSENVSLRNHDSKGGKVGYAWVNISQDVDWEGKDVGETIGSVMELALKYGIKPWVGTGYAVENGFNLGRRGIPTPPSAEIDSTSSLEPGHWEGSRVVPFDRTPNVFVDGGPLTNGGSVVVKIAT